MARYNEILTGRFNRAAQKLFSMKGPASVVSLNDELQAVLPFYFGVEDRYLESWDRFAIAVQLVAQGAGNGGAIRFRNPAGSNVVAVFEKINAVSGVGGAAAADQPVLESGAITVDLTTFTMANRRLDARNPRSPTLVGSSGTTVSLTGSALTGSYPTGGMFDFIFTDNQEIPLLPGDAIQLRTTSTNIQLTGSFMWRERSLEESERF